MVWEVEGGGVCWHGNSCTWPDMGPGDGEKSHECIVVIYSNL